MPSLLRNIRQKLVIQENMKKYMLYAFGETFLVVIGILIALQVNNWNIERQNRLFEVNLITSVVESLQEDSLLFSDVQKEIRQIDHLHRSLFYYLEGEQPADSIKNLRYLRRTILYNPVTLINHPDLANELLDSDTKQLVRTYFQHMDDVEYTIDGYNDHIEQDLRPFLGELQVYNYGYQYSLEDIDLFTADSLIDKTVFLDELEYPEMQQVLFETGLKLASLQIYMDDLQEQNTFMINKLSSYLNQIQ